MSHPANDLMYENMHERRDEMLTQHQMSEHDVETDDQGREYIEPVPGQRLYLPSVDDYDDQPPEED